MARGHFSRLPYQDMIDSMNELPIPQQNTEIGNVAEPNAIVQNNYVALWFSETLEFVNTEGKAKVSSQIYQSGRFCSRRTISWEGELVN